MSKKKSKEQDLFSVMDFSDNVVVEKTCEEVKVDYEQKETKNNDIKSETKMAQKEYTTHSVEEVKEATIKYFGGDQLAADVWMNKYALKDSDGNIFELTPDDMHQRSLVLKADIQIQCQKKKFLKFLKISNTSFHKAVRWLVSAMTSRFLLCQTVSLSEQTAVQTLTVLS